MAQAEQNIANAQDAFLESANVIATAARQGQLTEGVAGDHLEAIEAVAELVPNERSFFDEVRIEGISVKALSLCVREHKIL